MLGERMRKIRRERGETLRQVAKATYYSVSTVRNWEQNCGDVPATALILFCEHYGVSADVLLGLTADYTSDEMESIRMYAQFLRTRREGADHGKGRV